MEGKYRNSATGARATACKRPWKRCFTATERSLRESKNGERGAKVQTGKRNYMKKRK